MATPTNSKEFYGVSALNAHLQSNTAWFLPDSEEEVKESPTNLDDIAAQIAQGIRESKATKSQPKKVQRTKVHDHFVDQYMAYQAYVESKSDIKKPIKK